MESVCSCTSLVLASKGPGMPGTAPSLRTSGGHVRTHQMNSNHRLLSTLHGGRASPPTQPWPPVSHSRNTLVSALLCPKFLGSGPSLLSEERKGEMEAGASPACLSPQSPSGCLWPRPHTLNLTKSSGVFCAGGISPELPGCPRRSTFPLRAFQTRNTRLAWRFAHV